MTMRIFVAGATGVIGRRLIPLLVNAGSEVTAVARSRAKSDQLKKQGATPVTVNLFDPDAVKTAVAGHNTIINVATHIPSGLRAMMPRAFAENIRIRREGSKNLANAAIATRAQRFVQESYAPAYPDRGDEWIDEDVPIMPGPHLESVRDAESAATAFTRSGGAGIVLRFSNLYSADSSLTLDMVGAVRKGFAPVFGGPEGVHVFDLGRRCGRGSVRFPACSRRSVQRDGQHPDAAPGGIRPSCKHARRKDAAYSSALADENYRLARGHARALPSIVKRAVSSGVGMGAASAKRKRRLADSRCGANERIAEGSSRVTLPRERHGTRRNCLSSLDRHAYCDGDKGSQLHIARRREWGDT
jgi:Nucleoside-diphosphate-sugar epimerases